MLDCPHHNNFHFSSAYIPLNPHDTQQAGDGRISLMACIALDHLIFRQISNGRLTPDNNIIHIKEESSLSRGERES
jgi:hypothetical protein